MKLPPNHVPGVGVVKSSAFGGIGQKLLEKMGWSAGQGLGKNRDGRREAIRLEPKNDTEGLGARKDVDWNAERWDQIYASGLQQLGKVESDLRRLRCMFVQVGDGTDSEVFSSDEEVGQRWEENPDGTVTTAAQRELQIYARLAKQRRMGRWSSRKGKLDRIRKQEKRRLSQNKIKKPKSKKLSHPKV